MQDFGLETNLGQRYLRRATEEIGFFGYIQRLKETLEF